MSNYSGNSLASTSIVVVIPCYKVEKHIVRVVETIPDNVEYIVAVNDSSPDATGDLLNSLAQSDKRLVVVTHEKNRGVGGAMKSGYLKAIELGADVVVKMDGDGQMDPQFLEPLVEPIVKGRADFSKGNRFRDLTALRRMPLSRRIGNLGLSFMIKAASGYWQMFDPTNGYTAVRASTLKQLDLSKVHNTYFFESSMLMELYYTNAVIEDVPMPAIYGDEVSGLSRTRVLFEFPPKLFGGLIKRIVLKYFLFDFNMASVYLLLGLPLFFGGGLMGIFNFASYAGQGVSAPTGTVVIPTLLIILGFQLILSAISVDLGNYPQQRKGAG